MMQFNFSEFKTKVNVSREIPGLEKIIENLGGESNNVLVIADENTSAIADNICAGNFVARSAGNSRPPRCLLKSGEASKTWESILAILAAAQEAGLGRDGVFIGIGGGVTGDLAGFAASIYMRGCRLALVSTTLLGMVDASIGGKTGFDLFGIKNLAGSFYPAETVYMPLDCLATLPAAEWKSGMAELIKTTVLAGDDFLDGLAEIAVNGTFDWGKLHETETLYNCINRAVMYKGSIVSKDFRESGKRKILNLGHTFGHALESAAGLGNVSHGEAVAWGIVRSCELGYALGITPRSRALKIRDLIASFGYHCKSPHPLAGNTELFLKALKSDKKKKQEKLTFIVPNENSARPVFVTEKEMKLVTEIINGEFIL